MDGALHRKPWRDLAVALPLAALLTLAWTLRDWSALAALRLPDTDDAMRLQQIRDWLAGQAFGDLAQHRLGFTGLEMHWSRLPDLVPAAVVALLTPIAGAHHAELAAVLLWPGLLFAAALALTGAIARAAGAPAATAMIVAALAYPATTLFLPGRIDHHGLQLVLVLVVVRALLGTGTPAAGAVAGVATAASLAIGLETAPLLAAGGAAAAWLWVRDCPGAHRRLAGYGVALALALAAAAALLRTRGWGYPACDGFDDRLWRAAQVAALAPLALAIAGFALATVRARAMATLAIGAAALVLTLAVSPDCLHPYGAVDPLLARLWLANVAEAQPLFAAPAGDAVGYAGLALAGLAAGAAIAWRTRDAGWTVLLGFQLAAAAVLLVQLRGAYAGALLAAPALAALIAAARARGAPAMAGAWLVSAGLVYPLAGSALTPRGEAGAAAAPAAACTDAAALARIAALPPGRLIAPVDLGAFALAAGRHRVIAAPYHRNSQGNRAMYDFFLGPAARSEALARQWGIDYVALCPDSFDELGEEGGRGLAGALRRGAAPGWLQRVSQPGEAPLVYARSAP